MASLLQAAVNQPDWRANNALSFLIVGEGKRVAKAADGGKDSAPQLLVKLEPVPPPPPPEVPYTVRLYYAEPEPISPGERVFDVVIQGNVVASGVDIAEDVTGPRRTVVQEYPAIMITDRLVIELRPKSGVPLLNGVEILRVK